MKKKLPLFFVLFVALFACKKGSVDLSTKENTLRGFSVEGIYDITIGTYNTPGSSTNSAKLRLSITKDSIIDEQLELNIEGLPATVLANFTQQDGIAPFKSTLLFTLNGIPKAGKYPLKLVVKNKSGATKIYPFTLTVPIVDFEIVSSLEGNIYLYNTDKSAHVDWVSVYGKGILDTITLSYPNLPIGVEAKFNQNNVVPDFVSYVTFDTKGASNGTYPVSLIAKTNSGIEEIVYTTNLIITDNCAHLIPESFTQSIRYENGILIDTINYSVKVEPSASPNYFYFTASSADYTLSNVFNFYFNCNDNTIVIPKQNGNAGANRSVSIEGSGIFNPSSKEIILDCLLDNSVKTRIVLQK